MRRAWLSFRVSWTLRRRASVDSGVAAVSGSGRGRPYAFFFQLVLLRLKLLSMASTREVVVGRHARLMSNAPHNGSVASMAPALLPPSKYSSAYISRIYRMSYPPSPRAVSRAGDTHSRFHLAADSGSASPFHSVYLLKGAPLSGNPIAAVEDSEGRFQRLQWLGR